MPERGRARHFEAVDGDVAARRELNEILASSRRLGEVIFAPQRLRARSTMRAAAVPETPSQAEPRVGSVLDGDDVARFESRHRVLERPPGRPRPAARRVAARRAHPILGRRSRARRRDQHEPDESRRETNLPSVGHGGISRSSPLRPSIPRTPAIGPTVSYIVQW